MKSRMVRGAAMAAAFGSMQVLAAISHESLEITDVRSIAEDTFAAQLTVSGSVSVDQNTVFSSGTLHLGGTKETPAVIKVGGAGSKFTTTNVVIGANGGCGLLRSTGYWSFLEVRERFDIHENTPLSPSSEYIDFLEINQYGMAIGDGFFNNAEHPARVKFVRNPGSSTGYIVTGANWGATMFKCGEFAVEGTTSAPIFIKAGGGGGAFDPERYQSKLAAADATVEMQGKCGVMFISDSDLRCLQLSNVAFMNEGPVAFTNIGAKIMGPVRFGEGVTEMVFGGSGLGYLDLCGNVFTGISTRVESGVVKSSAPGGVLVFDVAAGSERSFVGDVVSPAVVRKTGAGELVLGDSAISALDVLEGVVRVVSNASVGYLTVSPGASVIVDGCEFACLDGVGCRQGAVGCVNGGVIAFPNDVSVFNPDISADFTKSGAGKCIVYDPESAGGKVHVMEGTLAFSREGLTLPYHRWTFKELSDRSGETHPKALVLSELWLWGDDGSRVAQSAMSNAADLMEPSKFNPGDIAWQCAVAYKEGIDSWLKSLKNIFVSGHNRPILVKPVIDPEYPMSWLSFAYRLPEGSRPVTGYDLCTQHHRPRSWIVEASSNGVDWITVDSRSGVEPVDNSGNIRFFDGGDYLNPTHKFSLSGYVSSGVENMPEALSVQVDEGAVLDFSSVEGGQGVDGICVDMARGCGAIVNANVLKGGTFDIKNSNPVSGAWDTGFSVAGFSGVENFSGWKVVVNGRERKGWSVVLRGGTVNIMPPGTVVILR